jgi:flavin-dependent dehydrogenase
MGQNDHDLVVVGGGIGGAALAKRMAEGGARVLVIERESEFRDRVRGEWLAPWGVDEAKRLDVFDDIGRADTCCRSSASTVAIRSTSRALPHVANPPWGSITL